MKKTLIVITLLVIIFASFSFVFSKLQARGDENNFFNRELRAKFAEYPLMRKILGLHNDGDGSADYLGKSFQKILVEADLTDTTTIRLSALELFKDRVQAITGKETSYLISDRKMIYERELTREKIARIVKKYRNYGQASDTAAIYFMVLPKYHEEPQLLGLTFEEYGVILFAEALADFTRSNPDTSANYEVSTALHEFGHQLGLPHNDEPRCLMNESIETGHVAFEDPEDVLTDFCDYEKDQLWRKITTKF